MKERNLSNVRFVLNASLKVVPWGHTSRLFTKKENLSIAMSVLEALHKKILSISTLHLSMKEKDRFNVKFAQKALKRREI